MDSNVVRTDFGSGLIRPRAQTCMDSKVVRTDFGSGLICPRAQTCCASPTRTPSRLANSPGFKSFHCPRWRIKFSLERFSHALRLEMGNKCRKTTRVAHFRGSTLQFCAEPQDLRKSTRVYRVIIGWGHVDESNSRSNVVQIRRASACVPSRWKVLSGEFRRRPTALAIKFLKPDRVGRR